jgi:small-conductance mechanosensitive channel
MFLWIEQNWHQVLWSTITLIVAIAVSLIARAILFWMLRRVTKRKATILGQSLVRHSEQPSHSIFPLLAVLAVLPGLPLPEIAMSALEHIAGIGLIAAIAWLAILLIEVTSDIMAGRYRIDVADNLVARRVQTQFQVVRRISVILVSVITVSLILMTFPAIKHIGMSILASAGLASLVVGMAMKDTLANLIAGVQIAFAQPFRVEDVVVINGDWGWIEEIGAMYVVVRIWDLRRLVLPLSYFLENPFENWTRKSADLLGYTYIYTDYTVPVDAVRAELKRICEGSRLWGGNVCAIQVSDSDQHTMQLRALMDVRNSSDAWDLRCLVREKLIDFLQKNYPDSLPRYRGELANSGGERSFAESSPAWGSANGQPARALRSGA